ncbi:hypothetical protein BKP35_05100 [Anaerobacillus arseniciselenatis]|uniref:EfeO-type cupredoxin-like domain-containing protein n=1 Tax=Anaerobacillus arseniciselenatis TaxID=85682 RepID=A0A1S2LU81_9BACI|nr:cupredoxin domain-containing protein [Anaerobacillus arseniciselenatis]OIJ15227.1 hypothetical protein BKP35_05100 [Anaerobacillus arseniciselenatis]
MKNITKWLLISVICFFFVIDPITPELAEAKNDNDELFIQIVTGEFSSKTDDGKEIEAYRWDPGTIFVPKGQDVKLSIFGVNGKSHPFYIEGTNIKDEVRKGEETIVKFRFEEEGIYRIVCTAHETIEQNGPMIGYIVVK